MKRNVFYFIFIMFMCITAYAHAETADISIDCKIDNIMMTINGRSTSGQPPINAEGTVLIPVRVLSAAFHADIQWDEANNQVTVTYGDTKIVMQAGSTEAYINGKAVELTAMPVLIQDGIFVIPLEAVGEIFGTEVRYDDMTGAVKIRKGGALSIDSIGDSYHQWTVSGVSGFYVHSYDSANRNVKLYNMNGIDLFISVDNFEIDNDKRAELSQTYQSSAIDYRILTANGKTYYVTADVSSHDTQENRRTVQNILNTVQTSYAAQKDLSNVINDRLYFSDTNQKIQFSVPAVYGYRIEYETNNLIEFGKFSVSLNARWGGAPAKKNAKDSIEAYARIFNKERILELNDIGELINGNMCYWVTVTVPGDIEHKDVLITYIVVEKDNDVYCLDMVSREDALPADAAELCRLILEQFAFKTIVSPNYIICKEEETVTKQMDWFTCTYDSKYWSFQQQEGMSYLSDGTIQVLARVIAKTYDEAGYAEYVKKRMTLPNGTTQMPINVMIDNILFKKVTSNNESGITEIYFAFYNGKIIELQVGATEVTHNSKAYDEATAIINSMQFQPEAIK